jgi:polyphosphate kinase
MDANPHELILISVIMPTAPVSTNTFRLQSWDELLDGLRKGLPPSERFKNRELSWLDFNDRVMEEAMDQSVPVLERLKFLAIVASNLDEFFMVRVAFIRREIEAGLTRRGPDGLRASEVLEQIVEKVNRAHENIGSCFRNGILPDLAHQGIHLITDADASAEQRSFAAEYYASSLSSLLTPLILDAAHPFPQLENGALYFCIVLNSGRRSSRAQRLALLRLPTGVLGRFVRVPTSTGSAFMLLDDVIRLCLPQVFPGDNVAGCYQIKIVRDSELDIDEVGSADLLRSILEGLQRRRKGPATRLLHDPAMPHALVEQFVAQLRIHRLHVFPGARNHSFADYMQLPSLAARPDLLYPPIPPLPVVRLESAPLIFDEIAKGDILLQHPYQSFSYVARFFEEAANDPRTVALKATLYRVGTDSHVAAALARAARNGKQVTVLVELRARFDEERNIGWARALEEAGAHVIYGVKGLKTHCKIALVVRKEEGGLRKYCHISTGNYNERTARLYSDIGLFTRHEGVCSDAALLFNRMTADVAPSGYAHLLVAPEYLREAIVQRIRREISNLLAGKPSGIIAKMNSLVDSSIIDELYLASRAGVPIRLIVRGICCLRPGVAGMSENIEVVSIIDRYLEHARIFRFENGGEPELFLASADWMPRNMNNRIEVAVPIFDASVRTGLEELLRLQLADNTKARILKEDGSCVRRKGEPEVRAQLAQYERCRTQAR